MAKNIQFINDTSKADCGDIPPETFIVFHDGYKLPNIPGADYLPFTEFKYKYPSLNPNKYIFIGMNKMINPSNRCEMVFDYMQTLTRNISKMSIDTEPFVGEPWRLWYHYDITNNDKFNVPHGYAIETEWKHWFYQNINDCRLSGKNIKKYIVDTYSDIDNLNSKYEFYNVDDDEWYNEAKDHVFTVKDTPKTIINELLKLANKRYSLSINYDIYREKDTMFGENTHKIPDLKIYRFVINEAIRRQEIYNAVIS